MSRTTSEETPPENVQHMFCRHNMNNDNTFPCYLDVQILLIFVRVGFGSTYEHFVAVREFLRFPESGTIYIAFACISS